MTILYLIPYSFLTNSNSGFAIVSLIFGLISTVFYGLVVFQILAIIFGYIALKKIKKKEATGKKRAIAGIILGILYIVLTIAMELFKVSTIKTNP